MKIKVLGVEIGSADDWDEGVDAVQFIYHDFTPSLEGIKPASAVVINYETGDFTYLWYSEDGDLEKEETIQLLDYLK